MKIYYNKNLLKFARELRKNGTIAEAILWQKLKNRQINNIKFGRQRPIGQYIVDFYCIAKKIIIEIDGITHELKFEDDKIRDKYLSDLGWKILRFDDEDVKNNLEWVIEEIKKYL